MKNSRAFCGHGNNEGEGKDWRYLCKWRLKKEIFFVPSYRDSECNHIKTMSKDEFHSATECCTYFIAFLSERWKTSSPPYYKSQLVYNREYASCALCWLILRMHNSFHFKVFENVHLSLDLLHSILYSISQDSPFNM